MGPKGVPDTKTYWLTDWASVVKYFDFEENVKGWNLAAVIYTSVQVVQVQDVWADSK
jgi:hypothetical protein